MFARSGRFFKRIILWVWGHWWSRCVKCFTFAFLPLSVVGGWSSRQAHPPGRVMPAWGKQCTRGFLQEQSLAASRILPHYPPSLVAVLLFLWGGGVRTVGERLLNC